MMIFSESNPKGDEFILQKGGALIPAIQNKTQKQRSSKLKTEFFFDLPPFKIDHERNMIF
jgi:hypothetical protein